MHSDLPARLAKTEVVHTPQWTYPAAQHKTLTWLTAARTRVATATPQVSVFIWLRS